MRYDDTLETVLASDLSTPFGKQSAWRQLVDLIGRRRVNADSRALSVLRAIRTDIPLGVRAATARGLEYADPPSVLVRLLIHDDPAVATPVLRSARLSSGDWIMLLPELRPEGRAILRHRRDLSPLVQRALESFGPSDFALCDANAAEAVEHAPAMMADPEPEYEPALMAEPEPEPEYAFDPMAEPEAEHEAPLADEPGSVASGSVAIMIAETGQAEALFDSHQDSLAEQVQEQAAPEAEEIAADDVAPVDADEQRDAEIAAEPEQVLVTEPVPSMEPAAGTEPMLAATLRPSGLPQVPAHWFGSTISEATPASDEPEAEPEPLAVVEAEEAAEPIDEADFSFVTLALGGLAAVAETRGQSPAATNGESPADQSGTDATTVPSGDIAEIPAESHGPPMTAGSDLRLVGEGVETQPIDSPSENEGAPTGEGEGLFQIADVVARIDAFWRSREEGAVADAERLATHRAESFRFETDSKGVIRWVDGVSRAPMVGLSLDLQGLPSGSRVDGVASGAFRRRAGFSNARLEIEGESDAAGDWLISAVPVFDSSNGRFTGYRGTARRPRADERAEPVRPQPQLAADSLRQLVHELRTPTNAIAGFAEMIESEMLGPVPEGYRDRATGIRAQARDLLGAIDDLDLAARIESAALALVPDRVVLRPLLVRITDDLQQLMALRGSWIALPVDDLAVTGDRRAVERLLARLLATLVSASGEGERIGVRLAHESEQLVAITLDRPRALADYPGESVLGIDDEGGDATLLGTGFALRLARNLARELGGSLVIEPESLTLRLPAPDNQIVEQAHLN